MTAAENGTWDAGPDMIGRDASRRAVSTRGDVDEVDAVLGCEERETRGVFDRPGRLVREAVLEEVASGDPERRVSGLVSITRQGRRTS